MPPTFAVSCLTTSLTKLYMPHNNVYDVCRTLVRCKVLKEVNFVHNPMMSPPKYLLTEVQCPCLEFTLAVAHALFCIAQSVIRLQLYARIRRIRFKQIFERLDAAGILYHSENIQPICENLLYGGLESIGHLTPEDLKNIDSFVDKFVNGDIERFKMTAKQIVRMILVSLVANFCCRRVS